MNKTLLSALALAPACVQAIAQTGDAPPHIVLILVDDMGYSDLNCYGGEINTPFIDSLAYNGCRFTNFTVAGRSCPSRASLMTGYYPHEAGMGWMANVDQGPDYPGYRGQISSAIPTLAEVMKENGYSAYMSGKWHLTLTGSYDNGPNGSHPRQRGFDRYYGSLAGNAGYSSPTYMYDDLTRVTSFPSDYYYTTAITDSAVSFINQHPAETPMFLFVAHQAPHLEASAPTDRTNACKEYYSNGFDQVRQARFTKMQNLGIVEQGLTLPTFSGDYSGSYPTWSSMSTSNQNSWINYMAAYAAMLEIVDDGVGEIMRKLREKGMIDNTVFLFLSDNGASDEYYDYVGDVMASLSNTPFRNFKSKSYNGGTASPLIICYGDPASKSNSAWTTMDGQITDQRAHLIDIMPTLVEFSGGTYPTTYKDGTALPGMSLVGTIKGDETQSRTLYFEHETSCAIIEGDWKLVSNSGDTTWELIDLSTDPFETTDVQSSNSAVKTELEAKWKQWAEETNVYPLEYRGWTERINYYTALYPNQTGIDDVDEEEDALTQVIDSIGSRVEDHEFIDGGLYAIKNVGVPGSDVTNTSYQGWLYIDTNNYMRIYGDGDTDPIGLSERHAFTIEVVDATAGTYRFKAANDRYISASGSEQSPVSSTTEPASAVYTLTKNTRTEVAALDAWYFDTGSLRIKPNNSSTSYTSDYVIFDSGQPQLDSWYIYPVTLKEGDGEGDDDGGDENETVQLPDGEYAITGWKQDGSITPGLIHYDPTYSISDMARYYRINTSVQYTEGVTPDDNYIWILVNDESTNTFTLQNKSYSVYIPANSGDQQNFTDGETANLQLIDSEKQGSDGSAAYYVTMTNYTRSGTTPYWYLNQLGGEYPNLNWYYSANVANGNSACLVTFHAIEEDSGEGGEGGDDGEDPGLGIENIMQSDGDKQFYDLLGRPVIKPTRGIYIVKTGTKAYKVYIND